MKMKRKTMTLLFAIVLTAFCISAASVLLVPFAIGKDGNLDTAGYLAGILFWAGLVTGMAGYFLLWVKTRAQIKMGLKKSRLPSVLRFFSNPPAIVTDMAFMIGMAGTVYCVQSGTKNKIVAVICLLLLLIGIYAHFLFNGKVYQYIRNSAMKASKENE